MTPTTTIRDNGTLQALFARHSVRSYRKEPIPEADLKTILEAAAAAPSAWNLQHWKFLLVEKEADKAKLLPIAFNQKQIAESSVTVAILGDTEANRNAEPVYTQAVNAGLMPQEVADRITGGIQDAYAQRGSEFGRDHAFMNASLAAMQLMIAAKALGYDSVPMSGFDADRLSQEFRIPSRYVPVMLISIGKGAEPGKPSTRLPLEQLIFRPE